MGPSVAIERSPEKSNSVPSWRNKQTPPRVLPHPGESAVDVWLQHRGVCGFGTVRQTHRGLVVGRRLQLGGQGAPGMPQQRVGDTDQASVAFLMPEVGAA